MELCRFLHTWPIFCNFRFLINKSQLKIVLENAIDDKNAKRSRIASENFSAEQPQLDVDFKMTVPDKNVKTDLMLLMRH